MDKATKKIAREGFERLAALDTYRGKCERLAELYDAAKERHDGESLTIYGEVSDLMDHFDMLEEGGTCYDDCAQDFDNLCGRLERE